MQSQSVQQFKEWFLNLDQKIIASLVGLMIGVSAGLVGLLLALLGPLYTGVIIIAGLAGLYVLTDIRPALYGSLFVLVMLPFGTFPVRIGLTPTLLDLALGAFVAVYLIQWITGIRRKISFVPTHAMIALYLMWLIFAFMLGLRYGMPTTTILRQFAETILSVSLAFILVDLLQDAKALRRLVTLIMVLVGIQALVAIGLFIMDDTLAESLLIRLSRIGYPEGGVIRYIESNPALGERAIGTWVDPNALGGLLAVGAALIAPQIFAKRPVLRHRGITLMAFATVTLALLLTSSRASFLAFSVALFVIVILRYRRYLPMLIIAGLLFLFLPQTQSYIDRLLQAFQGEDLATQMRIGEWTDSLQLIQEFPFVGIGFTGTPRNNLYTDVANMYLIMANQIGITGVLIFLGAMGSVFLYAKQAWKYSQADEELDSIHLGYNIALLTGLINAVADLYYYRIDFQSSITWFWLIVALSLASSRLVLARATESTVAETT